MDWQPCVDRGPSRRLRMNFEVSSQQSQTFLHASNADASVMRPLFGIKTLPVVDHRQMEFLSFPFEADLSAVDAAMSFHVPQTLLHNAEEAKRGVLRDSGRNVLMDETDLNLLLVREFFAKRPHPRYQTQAFQC